ncbi:MAG TPA: hypothetical protein VGJ45_20405, partial [Pseudonocardiaceae bacterium]
MLDIDDFQLVWLVRGQTGDPDRQVLRASGGQRPLGDLAGVEGGGHGQGDLGRVVREQGRYGAGCAVPSYDGAWFLVQEFVAERGQH